MSSLTTRGMFPELFDWVESPFTALRPFFAHPIRTEDYVKDGHYVVRAELAGVDPEKDIEITVLNGILTIRAERQDRIEERHHTEFRYGTFARTIALPASADTGDVTATYLDGILEVSVGLKGAQQETPKQVRVTAPVKPSATSSGKSGAAGPGKTGK